jgi:predicted DNA binding CopG/RHH family protein
MKDEKELMKSIDNNEWKSVANLEEMKNQIKAAAQNTLLKDQRMNIRIAKRDLEGLKTRALEEGLPYQTLVSSILHKYVTGKLREKEV